MKTTTEISNYENKTLIRGFILVYLHDKNLDNFIMGLEKFNSMIQIHHEDNSETDKSVWFRFPADSTLVTTIDDLKRDLSNKAFLTKNNMHLLERLDLSKDGNFEIHYS